MELPRSFLMTGLMLLGLGCTEKGARDRRLSERMGQSKADAWLEIVH